MDPNPAGQKGEVMPAFAESGDLRGAEFAGANLRGARFVESDLSGVVMRGVLMEGPDIDAHFSTRTRAPCSSTASMWLRSWRQSSTAAFPAEPTGASQIRMACVRPGLRS